MTTRFNLNEVYINPSTKTVLGFRGSKGVDLHYGYCIKRIKNGVI